MQNQHTSFALDSIMHYIICCPQHYRHITILYCCYPLLCTPEIQKHLSKESYNVSLKEIVDNVIKPATGTEDNIAHIKHRRIYILHLFEGHNFNET